MSILGNIENIEAALSEIKSHPMCRTLLLDDYQIMVLFPEGDFFPQGVRVKFAGSKVAGLRKALAVMERTWVNSYPATGTTV